jgi:glucosamine-6-phosphate deaminase
MRFILCENYEEMSKAAARIVAGCVVLNPSCVLGLATGSTPIGMYNELAEMNKRGEVDFSDVKSYNLDEYYPLSADNDQSYRYFMNENLFSKVNIKMENTHVLNGLAEDPEKECENFEKMIKEAGGIDIQVLGIGENGHIGFNEPAATLNAKTHLTGLTESTIEANSRFFNSKEDVPTQALTMGMGTIMAARKVILLASGKKKYDVVRSFFNDEIDTNIPSTFLKLHKDFVLLCDKEAYYGK